MTDTDPTVPDAPQPLAHETAPIPYPPDAPSPDEEYLADDDEEWVAQAKKGLRVPALTGALLLVLFAVCGLWGGAVLERHHDNKTATTRATAALATALAGRRSAASAAGSGASGATGGGAGGTGGFGGFGGAGRTVGTVSDVEGSTVFVTDASGAVVKVNLAPATKITKTAADIQLGQSVVVTGTKNSDGTTTAASLTIASGGAPGS